MKSISNNLKCFIFSAIYVISYTKFMFLRNNNLPMRIVNILFFDTNILIDLNSCPYRFANFLNMMMQLWESNRYLSPSIISVFAFLFSIILPHNAQPRLLLKLFLSRILLLFSCTVNSPTRSFRGLMKYSRILKKI